MMFYGYDAPMPRLVTAVAPCTVCGFDCNTMGVSKALSAQRVCSTACRRKREREQRKSARR